MGGKEGKRKICWESDVLGWRGLEREENVHNSSLWWRNLNDSCGRENESEWFDEMVSWKLGKGDKILFRSEVWLGDKKFDI